MSSLHISIFYTILTIIIADNKTFFFTKSSYNLWCQEALLSNSLFLYPDRIPIGIYRTSNIKTITYELIHDNTNNLFQIKTKRLADFYFLIINITRPFDLNREYQDVYTLQIQANIFTTEQKTLIEQTEIKLHIADLNDNDGVFDMDFYQENYTNIQYSSNNQLLTRFHASDADEIQHGQILYEIESSLNETFSLHPLTGELYLLTNENLQLSYEFDIYAYDRYRKRLVDNNMKTKAHVKLNFNQINHQEYFLQTIFNQTIRFREIISTYEINIIERKQKINLLNIHQPILEINIKPNEKDFNIIILSNSSLNTKYLFIKSNSIYLNKYLNEEFHLQLLICFQNFSKCQFIKHRFNTFTNFFLNKFDFLSNKTIFIDENLPVDSFITKIEINSHDYSSITYKLLNDEKNIQFYLDTKTGILRLAERLEYRNYSLEIQANIQLFNRRYSIETILEIHVREINKYSPKFVNSTPIEFFQLPYQFQAYDLDLNKQTNGRITYRLLDCHEKNCPFQLDATTGLLDFNTKVYEKKIYYIKIGIFDWGIPISLENHLNILIDLRTKLHKRDLGGRTRNYSRRWKKKSTSTTTSLPQTISNNSMARNSDIIYLNIGFEQNLTSYSISEDMKINTIIDKLKIQSEDFLLDNENLFFYKINDTNLPFIIDQITGEIKLIDKIDREKQDKYVFEIELKFKSIYIIKLQELYSCQIKQNSFIHFEYTKKFYQKIVIIINIHDINDNIPICRNYHVSIQLNENEIRKNLYQIKAYDYDLGENGTIIYSLFNYKEYFTINSLTGIIDGIKSFDYEEYSSSIDLYIIASDQGIQPEFQTICTTLHIDIQDLNDNVPEFDENNYVFHLFSDMPRYSIFGQIYGKDRDKYDQIIYSLSPNPYVTINKYTGHLRLKYNLHRLINQILNVTVYITDGLHKNQTNIQIFIQSFPDAQEPIVLSEPAYGLTINESLNVGSIITNIYRRFQLIASTIDFIEIIEDDNNGRKFPFSIDQQGNLRLTNSLIGLSKSSYWISIRLTRYRAHPPHTYLHVQLSIRQENFYLPSCLDLYQTVKIYDHSIHSPIAHIQAKTLNKNSNLQYSIENNEKIFSINKQTGFINLLSTVHNYRRLKTDYLLTIKALDTQYKLSTNCYLKVHLIRRRQLQPKFLYSSNYQIDLPEISAQSGRLRQRLFQIVALLNNQVYDKKLEIRYRFIDSNQYFLINRETGYIAAKQPLISYTNYEFNIEAFTVTNRDDDNKWRIVSSRTILPIKIRVLPLISLNKTLLTTIDSTINIDLLLTTDVGSIILQLNLNKQLNSSQWFIMIGNIRHTRYFHVDFQTGQLILIRPIEELINETNLIELHINVTRDWINMNTIKVLIRLINNQIPTIKFSQTDYYSSVSKNIPIGVEIAHISIENSSDDCVYSIDTTERIKSKNLFHINPYSGSITVRNSLENSSNNKHLLKILYRCEHNFYITSTNLHINILDEKNLFNQTDKSYRFIQDNYLIIFETTLIQNQKKYLMDFQLINNEGMKRKPQAQIIQGDPLGLFSIDSSSQSLVLVDESLSRSYIYPINLTIIDISQDDFINTTVIIFISNIGIHFPCPSYIKNSPYLFTYESLPKQSIDPLTGQIYSSYNSLTIRAFDPFTPINKEASNQAECIINNNENSQLSNEYQIKNLDFIFNQDIYTGYINDSFGLSSYIYNFNQEPIQIQIKNIFTYDITYHLLNQTNNNLIQLDEYAGLIKTNLINKTFLHKYSFLIYAKYQNFLTFTRLNLIINHNNNNTSQDISIQSIYEFKLYTPFVNNYTIGYLNKTNRNWKILNENILPIFTIDDLTGRLSIQNRSLIITNGNFYDFLIQDQYLQVSRIQIIILAPIESILNCYLNYLNNQKEFIGYIEILNDNQTIDTTICSPIKPKYFSLLNYNQLFDIDHEHGLLYYKNAYEILQEDLLLLIQIDNSRCLVTLEKLTLDIPYKMIRNGSQIQREIKEQKSSGRMKLSNGTLINYDIIPSQAPIFSLKSYEFSLNLSNITTHSIYIGQISAEPYNLNDSHIVYQFVTKPEHYHLDIDTGIIEYISSDYYNKTIEKFQIIARDLIYQQNTTINITIHISKPEILSLSSLIYHEIFSEILPPGSKIFQPNISSTKTLRYTLENSYSNLFQINQYTGEIILLNYFIEKFYSLKIHIKPLNQILIIKLTINDYNLHSPKFQNFPLNLSLTLSTNNFLTKFSGNDLDLNDNLKLKYYLLDKDQEKIFSINQTNGILTLKTPSSSLSKTSYQLNLGLSDGLYLTKNYLQISFRNYSKSSPKFSSNEYIFQYDQTRDTLGQIHAYDSDENDQISYELYQQPNEIEINSSTGLIKISKKFFSKDIYEFYASAKDLSKQIVYTKIKIIYTNQPKFNSNLYFISLLSNQLIIPSEIFQFELVDLFNQPLKYPHGKFQIKNQTNLFEINENKLILKENINSIDNYLLNINAYWKNFILQTTIQIQFVEKLIKLDKKFYQYSIEKSLLKSNYLLEKFTIKNFFLQIISTPLTRNDCHDNFYIEQNQLLFRNFPILSDLCFFELQLTDNISYYSSQIQVNFIHSYLQPKFSSNIYSFIMNNQQKIFRIFATSSNTIRYQLDRNPYGLVMNQTSGMMEFKYYLNLKDNIRLNVYAIDEKTNLNDTAVVEISTGDIKQFQIPENYSQVSICPNIPIVLNDQSLPGTVIQDISDDNNNNNTSTTYYILSGDKYNLFAINNLGQLYLTSSMLNQTSDEYYQLLILISASSLSYCRTNISINHSPKWSYFICPAMPIQWMIEEESPIGTIIGTVKDTLLLINNSSQLIDKISLKLNNQNPDSQSFLVNSQTGVITSNSRLDYEQKTFYSFSIILEPLELNCSLSILIKLININDNQIIFNQTSLVYNITENNPIPFYIGRIKLLDIDQLFTSNYEFYLRNFSTEISIDSSTGSIILYEKFNREIHGSNLSYDIIAIDNKNIENKLIDKLTFYIDDINDHGPKFTQDFYSINISKSLRINNFIYQINATSDDPVANGNFSYSLINPSDYFLIEQQTGIIRLKNSFPSLLTNFTLNIQVFESGINLTNQTNLLITIINDDNNYFNLKSRHDCYLDENQLMGTEICTIGKNSEDFIYELVNQKENFQIFPLNGTIVNRKIFDYEKDQHEFNLTIIVKDRENQSVPLSSLNLTVYLRNINDNSPEFLIENSTTLVYFYYPTVNTIIHKIQTIDKDQTNLTFEILNNPSYKLNILLNNTIELILIKSIINDHDDSLIIRMSDNQTIKDLYLNLIYLQREIFYPKILTQTIDGYINLEENNSTINFGQLFLDQHSIYPYIHMNLLSNEYFTLKQISNNQTELYFHSYSSIQPKHRLLQFQIQLTAIALNQSIPQLNVSINPILYLSPTNSLLKTYTIDINLWSIDREMLDRTLSLTINLQSQSTYQQFIIDSLPLIRENLAQIIGVNTRHVHIYTFEYKTSKQLELLLAIIRYPSRLRPARYIHKKLLYNVLKNSTNIFEKIPHIKSLENISLNQCEKNSCQNNGRCTSQIKLFSNQYNHFSYHTYQRLIPKYQWNIKCLCLNTFYGQYCQLKQNYQSPCLSNPCSALERCIEDTNSTYYTCQCIDEPCQFNDILTENTLNCININSPTCRDSSNTLTFDGYSFVRMNYTINFLKHFNLTLTFRTDVKQGKLILINKNFLSIQILNGYLNIELNKKNLFFINDININDGLWHTIYFSIDYTLYNNYYYYLLRLDNVFSNKISIYEKNRLENFHEFLIGNDFHGCLGNLTINNHLIYLQKQDNHSFIEHIGTNDGCQLTEIETRTLREYQQQQKKDDICSLYHPCYHGGICQSKNNLHFQCNCLKPRFTGRQCQYDLQPCLSNPCLFDEQCITLTNSSYSCISSSSSSIINLPMSTKNPLYIGIAVIICILILIFLLFISLIIYCQQKSKEKKRRIHINHDKPLVSAPLLIQKSSPDKTNPIESPMQTLLKLNSNGKQTIETMALVDNNQMKSTMNNFNDKQLNKSVQSIDKQQQYQSHESLNPRRNETKYYSTIGRMNIPPDNFLVHYNSIDYDQAAIPLVDPQSTDLFDFPSSPTKYFNDNNNTNNSNNYQICINSLSNLTEQLGEQNDIELTNSSNDSSNNEQTLLTSPISNGERKRSLFNGGSTHNIKSSTSSLQKAPVYAKVIKTSSKSTNGGMSTIERLRLSGSPLRLLSSSPTYTRTTSFLKGNSNQENTSLTNKTVKPNSISWKLNPRKLDSLKARRNSRHTDDDDDDNHTGNNNNNNETSQLTINRLRHASESDLTNGHINGKKSTKLSSFFQTEV